jgi:Peptidase M50B-like
MVRMAASPWTHELDRIGALQGRLNGGLALLIGLAAAVIALLPALWDLGQHLNTAAHEGGHALMCVLVGHRVKSVEMQMNGDGLTVHSGRGYSVLVDVVGYLSPGLLGLGAAKLIAMGHIVAVLWLYFLGLAILLIVARSWFAWVWILTAGFLLYLTVRYADLGFQVLVAYGMTWLLLISGFTAVLAHWTKAEDAKNLRENTRVFKGFWAFLWLLGSSVTLIVGTTLLV